VIASKALNAGMSTCTARQNGNALTPGTTSAGTISLATANTSIGAPGIGNKGFEGNFSTLILIEEVATGAPLTALETFFESLNTLAGI
jgi:hypothetical protein